MSGRIVVADDDELVRRSLVELLEDIGFDVVEEASDGVQAVDRVTRTEPDVVLMDMRMPVMDGIQATREIRTLLPWVQVVMLSAYDDPGFMRSAEEAGALCYVVKGTGVSLLRDVLTSAVDTARGLAARASNGDGTKLRRLPGPSRS